MNDANQNIPARHNGEMTDFIHLADAENRQQAHNLFLLAKTGFKDVSN
jgi:hypothetical protein